MTQKEKIMTISIEIAVVYENGGFKPLNPLQIALTEGEQLNITVQAVPNFTNSITDLEPDAELPPERIKELIKSIKTYKSAQAFEDSPESKLPRRARTYKHTIYIAEDFDAPLEDFEEYM